MLKLIGAAVSAFLISSCTSLGAGDEKIQTVQIEGTVSFGREITFRDIKFIGPSVPIKSKKCINGIFKEDNLPGPQELRMENGRVLASGELINYIKYGASDPFGATVSMLQNKCGNKYFIIIHEMRMK
jgi:hypothetical protein